MSDYLTADEKIDYIYKELKSQKRSRFFKIILKFIILWLIFYFYSTILINLNKDELITELSKNISKIVTPIAQDITKGILENNTTNTNNINNSLIEEIKNNPELLKKLWKTL